MSGRETVVVPEGGAGRIDSVLVRLSPGRSRGYFQRLLQTGAVTVAGRAVAPSHRVRAGDTIVLTHPERAPICAAEDIPLRIVHEDADIIVINKAPGIVVHPACGHAAGTLLNALHGHARGAYVPLLVHRLDKDTSGVMVAVKNEFAKSSMVRQFQNRAVRKTYRVVVAGTIAESRGRIEAPLGRSPADRKRMEVGPLATKPAVTEFSVLARRGDHTAAEAYPLTGRTHQIRGHFAYIGHPVVGDRMYGGPDRVAGEPVARQLLHAYRIGFNHPRTGRRVEYRAPLPEDMERYFDDHAR